jgi:hypothetical protein
MTMWQPSITEDHLRSSGDSHLLFTRQDRLRYLAVSGVASILLLIARLLQPSPDGVGTHRQLGLPPCAFLHFTGIPCPSCGLTTSVAHAARLHFAEAFITQPFGLIIFFSAVLIIPLSIYSIRRHIPWSKLIFWRKSKLLVYAMTAIFLLCWLYKSAAMKGMFAPG